MNIPVRASFLSFLASVLCVLLFSLQAGCGKPTTSGDDAGFQGASSGAGPGTMDLCDFQGGPEDAPVKVMAFFPGRHEDTIAVLKKLLESHPDGVRLEVVDWRTREGRERRDNAGLTCAGLTINGRNAFDVEVDGKRDSIMFLRRINGEWNEAQLLAAIDQVLAETN